MRTMLVMPSTIDDQAEDDDEIGIAEGETRHGVVEASLLIGQEIAQALDQNIPANGSRR